MKTLLSITAIFLGVQLHAQEILNGSWELHDLTEDCNYLHVTDYNNAINFSHAWGNEMINRTNLYTGDCLEADTALAQPVDGEWTIAVFGIDTVSQIKQSEISLELSDTLSTYKWYELSFYDKAPMGPPPPLLYYNPVKYSIGISLVPDAFGDSIYTSPYPGAAWVQRKIIFQAPNNGKHLTIRGEVEQGLNGSFLDHFVLTVVADSLQGCTEPSACNYNAAAAYDNNTCQYAPISIAASGGTLTAVGSLQSVMWSTGETSTSINPTANGSYWVSGMDSANCATDTAYYEVNWVGIPTLIKPRQLLRIVDVLGRESKPKPNVPLFYIYTDGTVEKRIVIE